MKIRKWRVGLVAVTTLTAIAFGVGPADASTVFTQGIQVNGPVVINSDGGHVALTVTGKQGSSLSLAEFRDFNGAPIFVIPVAGGPAVLGDNFRIFYPGAVFNESAQLNFDGSLTLGQQVSSDAAGVQQGGVTVYSGTADPNVTPPVHTQANGVGQIVNRPLQVGDWYLRGGAAFGLYAYTGTTWVKQ